MAKCFARGLGWWVAPQPVAASHLIRPDWAGDFTIKRIRQTSKLIISKIKTAEQLIAQVKTIADVCGAIEVTKRTYHRLKQKYGGMQAEGAKRLTQLEKENARL